MSHSSDSRYRPLPFAPDADAPQYNRELRERALALHLQEQLRNQPTSIALRADESSNKEENFGARFPSYSSLAQRQAEIRRAIRDQDVREYAASIREWRNDTFRTHLEEQQPFARCCLDTENFLARTAGPVPVQDELSIKDMISSHFMEQQRLMAEHQSEVRDMLQAILTMGQGKTKEIADSDIQEELSASPAQVASSLSRISSVTTRLETLLAAFHFPAELDFSAALGTADVFALTYTLANAPVLSQAYALSLLLADLDNIPSFGSDVVRSARRAVVTRVDQALKELDKGVEERRVRARAKKADPLTLPVD